MTRVAEEELMRRLASLRAFAVVVLDADGRVVDCNAAATRIYGLPANEVIGALTADLGNLAKDGRSLGPDQLPSAIARSTKEPHEEAAVRFSRRDGTACWLRIEALPMVEASGEVLGTLEVISDVTAMRESEEALRLERRHLARAGDRFRRVLESVPDAIAVYHENGFGYANPALVAMFGYASAAELVGKEVTQVLPGHTPVAEPLRRSGAYEERWAIRGGATAVVEVTTDAIDLDGERGTLLIARDIAARKRTQAQLLQQDRLASMGTLAAGVAHEINNPLAYVVANLTHLDEGLTLIMDEVARVAPGLMPPDFGARCQEMLKALADARTGADRVKNIVKDLRTFSRDDEAAPTSVDVHAVLDVCINIANNEVQQRASIVREYAASLPPALANEARLGQVFLNLIINAAHAIPEGHRADHEIRLVTRREPQRVIVEVRDTGCGIDPSIASRIFDPFFTTKPAGEGTGLGLSICHSIVVGLGGTLTMESVVDKGTVFRVALPIAATIEAPPLEVSTTPRARRARILVVDDEASIGAAIRRTLSPGASSAHEVVLATSARQVLDLLGSGEKFDLLISDLMMPDISGMALHERLLVLAPELARSTIFLTGGAFTPAARRFLEEIPNAKVEKPFDVKAFRKLVDEALSTTAR